MPSAGSVHRLGSCLCSPHDLAGASFWSSSGWPTAWVQARSALWPLVWMA